MRLLPSRETNVAEGVGLFLKRWLGQNPALETASVPPRRAQTGNINLAGTSGSSTSALLAPLDADFERFIEPVVLPLVRSVISAGWISYTSCEGHFYADGTADELHVGLIPCSVTEKAKTETVWQELSDEWDEAKPGNPVQFALMRSIVSCDGRVDLSTVDLYLCRRAPAPWENYFLALAEVADYAASRIYTRCD